MFYNEITKREGDKKMNSKHWEKDRTERAEVIAKIGEGHILKSIVVDRHHPNGAEIQTISDTGIITISNQKTKKVITKLIARPGQVKRFFTENEKIPFGLMKIARQHTQLGLNLI